MLAQVVQYVVMPLFGALAAGILIKRNWKVIKRYFLGKDLVILGTKAVGKTTLHDFLRTGQITVSHKATRMRKVKGNTFQLGDLKLTIREGTDIGGSEDFVKQWKSLFQNCDMCFYLFHTNRAHGDEQNLLDMMSRHLGYIHKWRKELKKNLTKGSAQKNIPQLYVVGSFADKIPEFSELNESTVQDFEENIRKIIKPALREASVDAIDVFIGSLKDKESIENLVGQILLQIAKK